ncbi:MAG: hypothetical protein ACRDNN_16665, partial [Gaiellaceae bacterium]
MRRKRTANDRRIARFEDDLARLRAAIDGLAVEEKGLLGRQDGLREKAAAAFVGEIAAAEVEEERAETETRLAAVVLELEDLRGLVAPIQRRLCEARLEQAEEEVATAGLDDKIAAEALSDAVAAFAKAKAA